MQAVTTKTKTKTQPITKSESVTLVKNLFRVSFSSIAYVRGLFDDEYFGPGKIGPTKYRKLLDSTDDEVKRYSDWLEKGIFDALVNKYLEVVLLEIYDGQDTSKLLECFSFGVSYNDNGASFSLGAGNGAAKGETSTPVSETKGTIKHSTSEVIRSLIELSAKLKPLPSNRVISMKLLYTPNTPADYEPPLFKKAASENVAWFEQKPGRITLKPNVVTPFHRVSLSIRSANIIDKGMYPLANAMKESEQAEKKPKPEEEARLAAERAAAKERELLEKKRKAEERANAEKKRLARIAAEKEQARSAAEKAEKDRLARTEKERKAKIAKVKELERHRQASNVMTKKKLMNPRKKNTSTKKKAASKPTDGKITKNTKAKKMSSPGTPPRRSTRKKIPTFTPNMGISSSGSERTNSSVDDSPSVWTMSNKERKTSEVEEKVHQD